MYYSPAGYWKGEGAVIKLAKKTGASKEGTRNWLRKQALWQIYLPPPTYIPRPTILNKSMAVPNEMHQIDLLFLPYDKVGRKEYKYAMTVVDVATRFKEAEPLTNKTSTQVADALARVYARSPLTWPKLLKVDAGKEFHGVFKKLAEEKKVTIQVGEPGNHRAQAIVERFNRTLAERLFGHQYAQEILYPTERSRLWVKRLPDVIEALNDETTRLIVMEDHEPLTPKLAMQETQVRQISSSPGEEKELVRTGNLFRYPYASGELEGGERRRATDPIWSLEAFELDRSIEVDNQPTLYYLKKGPNRSFVSQELQVVPPDTELVVLLDTELPPK